MGDKCRIKKDLIGKKIGKLTVLDEYVKSENYKTKWLCECECGNRKFVSRDYLVKGGNISCGCVLNSRNGLSNSKIYSIYHNMKDRCYNDKCKAYPNYGGKDIKISDEWFNFDSFYKWAINNGYEEGLTIERIDPKDDYSPSNCEWITLSENVARANKTNHRRRAKYLYVGISPDGKEYLFENANEFARQHNLNASLIRDMVNGRKYLNSKYKGWEFKYLK